MPGLTLLVGLPIFCVGGWLYLLIRGPRRGLALSLVMAAAAVNLGYWAIMQSRASTAGIGVLFLPGFGALTGLLAYVFARLRANARRGYRVTAWACLLASLGLVGSLAVSGRQTIATNASRDLAAAARQRQFDDARHEVEALLQASAGHKEDALGAEMDKRRGDEAFITAALGTPFVSEARLDAMAADRNLELALARNTRTPSATLVRIYNNSRYKPLLDQAMVGNRNTPPDLIRSIVGQTSINALMIDRSLAGNPSTPRDIFDRIAAGGDLSSQRALLRNDALDCDLLRLVEAHLDERTRESDFSTSVYRVNSLRANLCAGK